MATITASPTKLRDGTWGVRWAARLNKGAYYQTTVTTRAGKTWQGVYEVIASGHQNGGWSLGRKVTQETQRRTRKGYCRDCGERIQSYSDSTIVCYDCY